MLESLANLPFLAAVMALWAFALARGCVYYLIGMVSRGRPGSRLDRLADRLTRGYASVAERKIEQVGPKAVILTYPFYGISAASQILSGGLRMSRGGFAVALAAVSLPWAILQAVVGVAALRAFVTGHLHWALLAVGGAVLWWWWRRRHDGGGLEDRGVGSRSQH